MCDDFFAAKESSEIKVVGTIFIFHRHSCDDNISNWVIRLIFNQMK